MKTNNIEPTVQMLTPDQFQLVFGNVSESAETAVDDPVLRWYKEKGMKILSRMDMEPAVAKAVRLKRPDTKDYGGDSDEFYNDLNDYLDRFSNATSSDAGREAVAKKVIAGELGAESFRLGGVGSTKIVFVDNAGHALKVGRWREGCLNRELKHRLAFPDLECFPKLFAYAPDGSSYMCECARESTDEDFRRLFGCSCRGVRDAIAAGKGIRGICGGNARRAPKYAALADLYRFYWDRNGEKLCDIDENNWGLTVRDGQEVLIVIDYDL